MRASLFAILATVAVPAAALATPSPIERITVNTVTPGAAADFSAATFVYNNSFTFDTGSGTLNETLNLDSTAVNIKLAGVGGTTVSPLSLPNGTLSAPVSVTSPGGAGQGYTFNYDGSVGGAGNFLARAIVGGRYALAFNDGGVNFVANGGSFISTASIVGDWSAASSHTAATFGAGYTVTQNFVFNGTDTFFTVQTTNYNGTNPSISFDLLGAPIRAVPAPAGVALLGLPLLAMIRRRRG